MARTGPAWLQNILACMRSVHRLLPGLMGMSGHAECRCRGLLRFWGLLQ